MKKEVQDDLLWSYLDGNLAGAPKKELEEQLERNPQLQSRLNELKELDSFARTNLIISPSANFTQAVMLGIKSVRIKPRRSDWLLIIGVLFATLISTFYITDASWALDLKVPLDVFKPVANYLPSNDVNINEQIDFSLLSKGLLYLIVFLILLVFDRAILRPYFKNRQMNL